MFLIECRKDPDSKLQYFVAKTEGEYFTTMADLDPEQVVNIWEFNDIYNARTIDGMNRKLSKYEKHFRAFYEKWKHYFEVKLPLLRAKKEAKNEKTPKTTPKSPNKNSSENLQSKEKISQKPTN